MAHNEDRGYAPRMLVPAWPGTDTGDGRRNKRVTLRWWLVLQAFVAAVMLSAPVAKADPENVYEYAFIQTLDQEGISYPDADYALRAGYQVCNARYHGMAEMDIAKTIFADSNLTVHQAGYFVGAAEAAFCPEMIAAGGRVRS